MNDMALPQVLLPTGLSSFLRDPLHAALGLPTMAGLSYGELASVEPAAHPGIAIPTSLDRAIASRRQEYVAGRVHALAALQQAGHRGRAYPDQDRDRLPAWPDGWRGSISHSGNRVVALAIGTNHARAAGIDVQERANDPSILAIAPYIAQASELALLEHLDELTRLLLTFSAKEALYKAIYPHMRRFQDFDAAILREATPSRLRLELAHDWSADWPAKMLVDVSYVVQPGYIYCSCMA